MTPGDAAPGEAQPQPFNAKALEPAKKRKRSLSPSKSGAKRPRSTSPLDPAKRPPSPASEAPKRKRPTGRARITAAEREIIRQRQLERERELEAANSRTGIHDAVRQHYNAVPERGRDWRKTESRIKGLRSFNNWVKSTLIQKFSPNEDYTPGAQERDGMVFAAGPDPDSVKGLLVLDMGCGKGGDLGKWQQAPQRVDLYVGLDPAEVSIEQARERYRQMASRGGGGRGGRGGRGGYGGRPPPRLFHGEFIVQDCFGSSIERAPIVRDVGFDGSGGPSRFGGGGFDVVTMMFCMHYAFENEDKARQMLRNVAGALKKGGRLIGCIPNSDVLSEKVEQFNARVAEKKKRTNKPDGEEHEVDVNADAKSDARADARADTNADGKADATADGIQDAKPDARADAEADTKADDKANCKAHENDIEEGEVDETAEWGNDIYRVRFPGKTPIDGIFRPPFGWKYNFFLHEAVEEVPEYVVPWEAFRAIAEDYNLEMQYHKCFADIWKSEQDNDILGPLSERMGVRERNRGPLLVSEEEMEAANFYVGFCFYKV